MLFEKIFKGKEKEKNEQDRILIPVKYNELSTPFYKVEDHIMYSVKVSVSVHKLDWGEVGNLWTAVEYIGGGLYKDVVTGMEFSKQDFIDYTSETIMKDIDSYDEIKDAYLESPLAIEKSIDDFSPYPIRHVPSDFKKIILEETLPKKEEIIAKINSLHEEASNITEEYLDSMYQESLKKHEEIQKQKEKEEQQKQKEIDYLKTEIAKEKERIKKEEEISEKFRLAFLK